MVRRMILMICLVVVITSCTANISKEETIEYFEYSVPKSRLSEETIEWLENFNALPYSSKIAVSYIPHDLAAALTEIDAHEKNGQAAE